MKAFENAASESEIEAVNKKIVEKSEPVVERIMSGKIPRSADPSRSGRGFGTQEPAAGHAADSIPIGSVKTKDGAAYAEVGWYRSDHYAKFINWGTVYQPPREFIFKTGREADAKLQDIAEKEYQAFLDRTIK